MRQVSDVWMPDRPDAIDDHLIAGHGTYQFTKLLIALSYVKNWRNAIDVGAHVGTWSMQLQKRFTNVYAFEPVPEHRDCLIRNAPDVEILPFALGDHEGVVKLKEGKASSGDTHISEDGTIECQIWTLDSFNIPDVDFMKLDCEGYELFALKGGEKTLEKYHPVIIVEQKPGKAKTYNLRDTEAVGWLMDRGYKLRQAIAGDYILT